MDTKLVIPSPLRRQNTFTIGRKPYSKSDEMEGYSVLAHRHRFLLMALVLLTVLCTIYLYFAITFGMNESCAGLTGEEKVQCSLELAKRNMGK